MVRYKIQSRIRYLIYLIDILGFIIFLPLKIYNQRKKIKHEKILVIKNDFIGDMVLATPFFEQLKKKYPGSHVTVLCRSFSVPVLENNPFVDKYVVLNTPWLSRGDSVGYLRVLRFLIKNIKGYDVVYDLHTEPRNILLGFLVGKSVVGYSNRGFGFLLTRSINNNFTAHIVQQNLDLIGCNPVPPKIFLTTKEIVDAKSFVKTLTVSNKLVGIHPGTSDEVRQWPAEKFNELIKIIGSNHTVLVFETDCQNAEVVVRDTNAINLCGKLSLRSFFAMASMLDMMICLESMAGHVASAVNTKPIVIYSSTTDVGVMRPYGCDSIIQSKDVCNHCGELICVKNDSIKNISVDDVITLVES